MESFDGGESGGVLATTLRGVQEVFRNEVHYNGRIKWSQGKTEAVSH